MDKGWPLALWVVACSLVILYAIILIYREVSHPMPGRKPCEGCSDADLGLTLDEDEPKPKGAKGA